MKRILLSVLLTAGFSVAGISQNSEFTNGLFVLNEGGAGAGNASVSFISSAGELANNVFSTANNGMLLGDTAQCMGFNGDNAYVVLNISSSVQVMNATTLEHITTITEGLEDQNPRYIEFYNNKAYVTCWGSGADEEDDHIAIIDLVTNTVTGSIAMEVGIERILKVNDKFYVAHQGGFGQGNKVSVVNPATGTVEAVITVGDVPNSMEVKDGFLYVICGGNPFWAETETAGSLVKINLADNTVVSEIDFPEATHPSNLDINGDVIYYTVEAGVYKMQVASTQLPAEPLFSIQPQGEYGIYGFDVIDNKIYISDDGGYVSPATVYVYTEEGSLLESSYTVGLLANGFYKSLESGLTAPAFDAVTITVYPNPVSDVLYVNTNEAAAVTVYDLSGRMVKSEAYTASGVNVSTLSKGIYLAEVTVGTAKTTKRIVIE
jgi:hypothetical protein